MIQPIALPSGAELNNDFIGWNALASGFGLSRDGGPATLTQPLQSVTLPVIPNIECERIYTTWMHPTNVCVSGAGGRSTCSGDSGGPLVVTSGERRILVSKHSTGSSYGIFLMVFTIYDYTF